MLADEKDDATIEEGNQKETNNAKGKHDENETIVSRLATLSHAVMITDRVARKHKLHQGDESRHGPATHHQNVSDASHFLFIEGIRDCVVSLVTHRHER